MLIDDALALLTSCTSESSQEVFLCTWPFQEGVLSLFPSKSGLDCRVLTRSLCASTSMQVFIKIDFRRASVDHLTEIDRH